MGTPCPPRLQLQTLWIGIILTGKMIFWGDKCLTKVDHALKTGVLNIPDPVRMTPCPSRLLLQTLWMGVILTGKVTLTLFCVGLACLCKVPRSLWGALQANLGCLGLNKEYVNYLWVITINLWQRFLFRESADQFQEVGNYLDFLAWSCCTQLQIKIFHNSAQCTAVWVSHNCAP